MGYSEHFLIRSVGTSYVASATLLTSNDANHALAGGTWALLKAIQRLDNISATTQLRISFDVNSGGGGGMTHLQIRKNGINCGVQINDNAGVWATHSQNISFTDTSALDTFELWGYQEPVVIGLVRNFRIYGDVIVWQNTVV